ncbi:hypothetical protein BaRGS_00004381 [Batillaria attramentaria]|uniref:Uncharacterized protein n=1 Tax=Batillaria attramentaria TaxID=370345 RepID=A0ABD0LXY7_9CAEN
MAYESVRNSTEHKHTIREWKLKHKMALDPHRQGPTGGDVTPALLPLKSYPIANSLRRETIRNGNLCPVRNNREIGENGGFVKNFLSL